MSDLPSRALYGALFDDAALFPPGNAPMGEAIPAHWGHRTSRRAPYVGPFLVSDARTAELRAVLAREDGGHGPLAVAVTVPGGADGVAAAVEAVCADPALSLVGTEVAAEPGQAARTAAVLTGALPAGAEGYVEVARGDGAAADTAALAGTGASAKFRTGGVTAAAHPGEHELASLLAAAVGAGVPFKCTAGLHHAVRHTSTEGFEQHGFLNVLLATHALRTGGTPADAEAVLADRDGPALAARAAALTAAEAEGVRSSFRSFGTCSITEPLEDLVVLGALTL
ncbi:hypothetical protein GCM10007079_21870 [Nocardiopsis terrae]|uniref:Uncharacterized protein n=1 Tax=Nocardiopsis terrae TaxID=372655 RepID=A0ABR9HH02_9ACTN|nr:hypothetical protein [Nocardiopsis terrae]MBE1458201.1 hypothetical protein [Nocardiopsis terrae]GHC81670.1 hypothetical protein GCM10007079_21870 [Nocardiopsis terrae]